LLTNIATVLLLFPSIYSLGICLTMATKLFKTHVTSGFRRDVVRSALFLGVITQRILTLDDGSDRFYRNVGKELPLRCEISQKSADFSTKRVDDMLNSGVVFGLKNERL
jgi:hypothetical protein